MKKTLSIFLVLLGLMIVNLVANSSFSYAQDVWVYSRERGNTHEEYYVDPERIIESRDTVEFTVPYKIVSNGKISKNERMLFSLQKDGKWYCKFETSTYAPWLVNSSEAEQNAFDVCVPYCTWAQKYPR